MSVLVSGAALRRLRTARGWDQQTLAAHAGISASVVSRVERGLQHDLRVSVIVALADVFAVTVDALLERPLPHAARELVPELASAVAGIGALTQAQQRQVAAVVHAYLATVGDTALTPSDHA